MVEIDNMEDNIVETAKKLVMKLGNDKHKLEEELKESLSILEKNNIGMDQTLTDSEGFPRADVDIYQIRHARQRIICIRNDLREIMKNIEKQLHLIHAENKQDLQYESMECEQSPNPPIAKVSSVVPNSPADKAGLKVNDVIINFGSVNYRNFSNLTDISNVVQHSVNLFVKVTVARNDKIIKIYLKPRSWSGSGMLGCIILPLENVER